MLKLVIFGDRERPSAAAAIDRFTSFVKGKADIIGTFFRDQCDTEIFKQADIAVAFGGDGTILSAARDLSSAAVAVIGVNVGKLGFLAEFKESELEELFDRVTTDKSLIEERMMLKCSISRDGKDVFAANAINDVVINAGQPHKMLELGISVSGQSLASCISDGLIISTPTGSTAYNISAGGPIISADLSAIVVAPICPHTLSFRPIVISPDSKISVAFRRLNEGTQLTLDGQISCAIESGDLVLVEEHNKTFKVVNNPLRTKWDTLASKLSWAGIPKYDTAE